MAILTIEEEEEGIPVFRRRRRFTGESQRPVQRAWIVSEEEDDDCDDIITPNRKQKVVVVESNSYRKEEQEEIVVSESKIPKDFKFEIVDDEPVKGKARLTDIDVFDCPVCLHQLFTPVFQCENGHIVCSSCCSKVNRKCPFCCLPIGIRCRGLERFIESMTISCKYAKHGCREMIPYRKKLEHEETCPGLTICCPLCSHSSSAFYIYLHLPSHKASVTNFTYNTTFSVSIDINQKQMFLQQKQRASVVFILNHQVQEQNGQRVFYLVCIGRRSSIKNKFSYQLTAESESRDTCLTLKSIAEVYTKLSKHTPVKNYLTVPSEFADYNGLLSLSVCINSFDPEAEVEPELLQFDTSAHKVLKVVLSDPSVLECPICLQLLLTPVFQCENGHLACLTCCSKLKSKCTCCGYNYNRCRGLEKVIQSIDRITCKNAKYGCEKIEAYSNKSKHEQNCPIVKCFCPLPSCPSAGSCADVYLHFGYRHEAFITKFAYNTTFSLCIDINQKHVFLQERKEAVIFILNHQVQQHGERAFYVDCIATRTKRFHYAYQLTAETMDNSRSFKSVPETYTEWSEHSPTKNYLKVPSDFANGPLSLSICIMNWEMKH